jgi:hypothetical protein
MPRQRQEQDTRWVCVRDLTNTPFSPEQTPVVIYYSRVAIEMAKIVFQSQKMAPP